ncbi:MAG: ABC transporter ATP-binding protein [Acaryochloris sp. RU_4_1]|nr:ABC transporter ATP-binding protein [Acaryochloris sp. RU_4_1]NJR54180.1 ABC transporter ATP-binding protein [Acaryochloris sp. CRU_2_0]
MMNQSEKELQGILPGIWHMLVKFWPQIRKRQFLIGGSMLALLVETALGLLEPWPLKYIFDDVLLSKTTVVPEHVAFLGLSPMWLLAVLAFAIVVIAALRSVTSYLSTYGMALAAIQVLAEVRSNLYSHIQRLSLSFHQQFKSGDLITRVTYDIERLRLVTIKTALPFLANIITIVGMVGIMFWLNWELALISMAVFPLFSLTTTRIVSRIRKLAKKHRRTEGLIADTTSETLSAIKVVQALSLHEMLEQNFLHQNTKSLDEGARSLKLAAFLEGLVKVLMALILALVIWRSSLLVIQKTLTPGDVLIFVNYLKTAFEPMRQIAKQIGQIAKATASGERVIDILDYEPNVRDLPGAKVAHPFYGAVQFEQVSFGYDPNLRILKHLDLSVEPGQQIAVVGPSGSGKSTLVSLILRLYDPTEGRILIDGKDIRSYKLDSLRQQISVVMQDSVLFAVSIRENITYGRLGATDQEVERAARLANAHDFIMDLPDGYDTILGERGGSLSGGQRQRIAIARAAIRHSPIVILDEPTTGLDSASEHAVNEALNRLTRGSTTFLISHNLLAVEHADQILYLEKGNILERGTHGKLMRQAGRYAALYRLQNESNGHTGVEYVLEV